jgi:hypothetical protein
LTLDSKKIDAPENQSSGRLIVGMNVTNVRKTEEKSCFATKSPPRTYSHAVCAPQSSVEIFYKFTTGNNPAQACLARERPENQ